MLPNNNNDIGVRLKQLIRAIQMVYASVFFKSSKSYISSTSYKIDEEKMAIVIEEIVGQNYGKYFYPTFAGVAKSYNYYPFSYMKSEEGVAQVCLGLGRLVIEGGNCLRFSPKYPEVIPQFASVPDTFKSSQKHFYALDLSSSSDNVLTDDSINLVSLEVSKADESVLNLVCSTYDLNNNSIIEDNYFKGPKVVTFANILKYQIFPLSKILSELLEILRNGIGRDIEIEFAVNIFPNSKPVFNILQVRPLVINKEETNITDEDRQKENAICRCKKALGNGTKKLRDIIFVEPDTFDTAKTVAMAEEVGKLNEILKKENSPYLLIGMGRWGTADPWLGIPVTWEQISFVEAIVETSIRNFFFDPSQGSHFFQNITARSVGYFSVGNQEDYVNWDYLKSLPVSNSLTFVKHVKLQEDIIIKIDGKTGEGVINLFKNK